MNKWILAAAAFMGLTLIAHIFGGGPEVIDVVMASDLPDVVRMLSAVVWHIVSITLAVFTVGLVYLAGTENRPLELMMAAVQIGFVALFLGYGIFGLGNITEIPQWTVFVLMPVLTFIGSSRRVK